MYFANIDQDAKHLCISLCGLVPKYYLRIKCWCDCETSASYNSSSTSFLFKKLFIISFTTKNLLHTKNMLMFQGQILSHQGSCCTICNNKLNYEVGEKTCKFVFETYWMYFLWCSFLNIIVCCTTLVKEETMIWLGKD